MAKRRFAPRSARGRRRALRRNQVSDLILYGSLTTTEARAKILKSEVERLISRAKKADLATRRRVLAFLPSDQAAKKLLEQIVPQFSAKGRSASARPAGGSGGKERVGGYVRVVKLPPRRGDNAPMARVEFVEKIAEVAEEEKRGKTRKETKGKKQEAGDKKQEKKKVKVSGRRTKRVPRKVA